MSVLKTILPRAAWGLMQERSDAMLIDVRSAVEYFFVGHPVGAVNVPWIDEPDWKINPDFVAEVRLATEQARPGRVTEHVPVLLICRSGVRSLEAGRALLEAKFRDVYNIAHGFEGELDEAHHRGAVSGWRFDGLPWEQC